MKKLIQKSNGKKSYLVLAVYSVYGVIRNKYPEFESQLIEDILFGSGWIAVSHKIYRFVKPIIINQIEINIMSKEQLIGVLEPKEEKQLSKQGNQMIKPFILQYANTQKGWLKLLLKLGRNKGGIVLLKIIQYLDNNLAERLGEPFKSNLRHVLLSVMNSNPENFQVAIANLANDLVNIDFLNDAEEQEGIDIIIRLISWGGRIVIRKHKENTSIAS